MRIIDIDIRLDERFAHRIGRAATASVRSDALETREETG